MRFFKKIQDWILKSERIRKWILRFFTRQINRRSFGSLCIKGTEESSLEVDSSVPLMHHDPKDLGLICLVKKRKIYFRILSDFRIQSWIFLKKRTLILSRPRRIGSSSHTALRSGCESFCHVFDYFLAWSGIFEIFDVVFSCGIWCYGTEKGKMNLFPLSSFLLSNFGGNEKVCNTQNPAYL